MSEYDVVILVADSHAEVFVDVLLKEKREAIGVGPIRYEVIVHYESDPGVFKNPYELLRAYQGRARKVLVMLDEEWSGSPGKGEIEKRIKELILRNTTWGAEDIEVVVLSPEIEVWAWYDTWRLTWALGVDRRIVEDCRKEYGVREDGKPVRPKEALECISNNGGPPYGGGMLRLIAQRVSRRVAKACRDEGFGRFVEFLRAVGKR